MMMERRSQGWTLIELCVVISLLGLMLSFTVMSLKQPAERAGPRIVAGQTAEFLRRARGIAMKENYPVAVVFPTAQGTSAVCQSLAQREGETNPQIKRVKDFAGENPDTILFVGTYPASGNWSRSTLSAGSSNSFITDVEGAALSARILSWVGPSDGLDPMFIFQPDGTVATNDLPHLRSSYRIVVSQGAKTTNGAASGSGPMQTQPKPKIFELKEASHPYTVTVDASGTIEVSPGLADGDGSTPLSEAPIPTSPIAPSLTVANETRLTPKIITFSSAPTMGGLTGIFGIEQLTEPGRQVTLLVTATQDNDEELYCEFSEENGKGQFSSPGVKCMRYQPEAPPFFTSSWRGAVQWNPPANDPLLTTYKFNVKVTASRGGSASSGGSGVASIDLALADTGRIFFGGKLTGRPGQEIYCIRALGVDLNRVTTRDSKDISQWFPAASRDGNKLLYMVSDASSGTASYSIRGQSRRGGISTLVADQAVSPSVSDDATVTVFESRDPLGDRPTLLTASPDVVQWPPVIHRVFLGDPLAKINRSEIGMRRPAVSPPLSPQPSPPPSGFISDSPKNRLCRLVRKMAFEADYEVDGVKERAIYTTYFHDPGREIPGMDPIRQTKGGPINAIGMGGDSRPAWSPNCKWLAFCSNRDGHWKIYLRLVKDSDTVSGSFPEEDNAICLTPNMNNCLDPYFSPNGKEIVFASDDHAPGSDWDLYTVSSDPTAVPATVSRLHLDKYSLFGRTFENINNPVWTL